MIHDQITARICVEYFTIGHPPVFATDSPTLLGIGWGIIATWWVGLLLGLPLAIVARAGRRPTLSASQLTRPILTLLMCMAVTAFVAGIVGYVVAARRVIALPEPLASLVPEEHHVGFLVDWFTHLASYASGFLGGLILIVWAWRKRRRSPAVTPAFSTGL